MDANLFRLFMVYLEMCALQLKLQSYSVEWYDWWITGNEERRGRS
jgi:hypothetical protein